MTVKLQGVRPTVPDVQAVLDCLTPDELRRVSSATHTVLDDGNYDHGCARGVVDYGRERGDALVIAIGLLMQAMSRSQRGRLDLEYPA